jgi:hypothetical protein
MVVLDFFAFVPVTVRQSPTATALTVSVSVSVNDVVVVHETAVCPAVGLCTCMVVPEIDATLPLAPPLGAEAASAPADIPKTTDVVSRTTAGPIQRPNRLVCRGSLSIIAALSFISFRLGHLRAVAR